MSNIRTPHFDYPFRFGYTGHAVETEQNSIEDIQNCVTSILLTNKGDRVELPDFGIDSPIFGVQPLQLDEIYSHITDQEPRSLVLLSTATDPVDSLKAIITVALQNDEPTIGGT